jgi:hypothetical protein
MGVGMADGPPKEWLVIQPSLEPILTPVNAVIATIDSVLQALIVILNIVQMVLNVIKAFLIGLLDPLRAIIEAIIAEIRQIIQDLRQLGIYLHGDWNLCTRPFKELRGGYTAYERRMLKRLLDRRDPDRPDFSSSSAALAFFAYVSLEDVTLLIEIIMRLRDFFGGKNSKKLTPFPPPSTPIPAFGSSGIGAFLPQGGDFDSTPSKVRFEWVMPSSGQVFSPGPAGYILHVSTIPDGFGVVSARVDAQTATGVENLVTTFAVGTDPNTGAILRLHGGICDLVSANSKFADVERTSPQANRLFLQANANSPLIPPSKLINPKGGTPIGAASYFFKVPAALKLLGAGQPMSATLDLEDLPLAFSVSGSADDLTIETEEAQVFFVRVRAVTTNWVNKAPADSIGTPKSPVLIPPGKEGLHLNTITDKTILQTTGIALKPAPPLENKVMSQDYGDASEEAVVAFPSDFTDALITAMALVYLCRADLTEVVVEGEGEQKPAGNTYLPGGASYLEDFAPLVMKGLNPAVFFGYQRPVKFGSKVLRRARMGADPMLNQPPPTAVIESLAEEIAILARFMWSDINSAFPDKTILQQLKWPGEDSGYGPNPTAIQLGSAESGAKRLRKGGTASTPWISRDGVFPLKDGYNPPAGRFWYGMGFSDNSPVLFGWPDLDPATGGTKLAIGYVRKLLIDHEDAVVLKAAATILQVAAAVTEPDDAGGWMARRPLQDALAPLDAILVDIEKFLLAILDGLKGIIDKIIAYIEAIQARIYQLQALIEMIRALLQSLAFELPSVSGLVLVENGTAGLITGLVTAGNKPSDSSISYGGGIVAVAGGLPMFLLELLAMVFSGGGEDE